MRERRCAVVAFATALSIHGLTLWLEIPLGPVISGMESTPRERRLCP